MSIRNRELSQFGSFIYIEDSNQSIGITTLSSPNVGIGTTNATSKLTVVGNTNVSGAVSATGFYLNGVSLVDAEVSPWIQSGSNAYYQFAGNIGIGSTNPQVKLDVVGDVKATGTITGSNISLTGFSVASGVVTASQFNSTVATGTPPLTVNSQTLVTNLNADYLRGKIPPSGNIVGTTDSQTLTNKTLTSPIISSIVNGGTLNLPTTTGTLVSTGDTAVVTSNMIADLSITNTDVAVGAAISYTKLALSGSIRNNDVAVGAAISYSKLNLSNSITNADIVVGAGITNGKLANSTISGVSLGNNLPNLTFGTYLTGTSYNGTSAVTLGLNASSSDTTQNTVVVRENGNFSGNVITATNLNTTNLNTTNLNATDIATISVSSASTALRITQSGSGNALVVEDSSTPDITPFVVTGNGSVGIGTTNPTQNLHIQGNVRVTGGIYDSNNSNGSNNQVLMSNGTNVVWQPFVSAVGGATTTDITVGSYTYRVHQFTSSGTFAVTTGGPVEYFVLGGGGGGGGRYYAGGGGAGGLVSGEFTVLPSTSYTVEVGAGGSGGGGGGDAVGDYQSGMQGDPSRFGNIISPGGGGGGSYDRQVYAMGKSGGCGGGASGYDGEGNGFNLCGSGSHGYRGGRGGAYGAGGGGGLGEVGGDGVVDAAGKGGDGIVSNITGTNVTYGGGGGGARGNSTGAGGAGGAGGGGAGGSYPGGSGQNGTANTGGGGGGACDVSGSTGAGDGGSGIVIIRYRIA